MSKPTQKPAVPHFSSGPCAKRPGWTIEALKDAATGRSHRAKIGKAKLEEVITRTRALLGVPADYRIGIVPASDTGAVEMAMWSLLGAKGADMVAWESFGQDWITDVVKQLKLDNVRTHTADYGKLPDLSKVDTVNRDVVFTWNGTTSGVRVPNADWISPNRNGLTICDATSAVFAMDLPWEKLDVVTYSWQKVLGGEGAHGMIILSPKAVERLESYTPKWPLPKIFRLTSGGKISEGIFKGETINTPSMICVEDALDGLKWTESVGGVKGLIARSENNLKVIKQWAEKTGWIGFLAEDPATVSCTSICMKVIDPEFQKLSKEAQEEAVKKLTGLLEKEGVAYDIGAYRSAPPGIRIWGGATVETKDIELLTQWLDWAYGEVKQTLTAAA